MTSPGVIFALGTALAAMPQHAAHADTTAKTILALATALVAVGIWWVLPGSSVQRRLLGAVLTLAGLGLFGSQVPGVGDWLGTSLFRLMGAATVVAAVATISCRNPLYCAIWFGMTLTGTAGLFLLGGAEFLAVATIVVYAGAILVTFLFVLMLSETNGHSPCDRHSWEAMVSAFTGAVLIGILTMMIGAAFTARAKEGEIASTATTVAAAPVHHDEYKISRLGAELFTRYLIAVEAAGTLLFAALVGAAVIVAQGRAAMKRSPAAKPGVIGSTARLHEAGQGGTANAS